MKKVILSLTVVALATVVFSSCQPDKTNEDYLKNSKGWVLSKAISNPAYVNNDGVSDADLSKSYFYECEMSDILTFKDDKDGKRVVLTSTCDAGVKQKETIGTWKLDGEDKLTFRIPFFEEDVNDVVTITNLDGKNFEYTYAWTKQSTGVRYVFTMTYVQAK